MFDAIRKRLRAIETAADRAAPRAARRIAAKLRQDARSRIGKVPEPIEATATATGIQVTAPDFVLKKAQEKGQIEGWKEILAEEIRDAATED